MIIVGQVVVTPGNLLELIQDKNVYAIKHDYFHPEKFNMIPIGECTVDDLNLGTVAFVRVEEERS